MNEFKNKDRNTRTLSKATYCSMEVKEDWGRASGIKETRPASKKKSSTLAAVTTNGLSAKVEKCVAQLPFRCLLGLEQI